MSLPISAQSPPAHAGDEQLLQRVRGGDSRAGEELARRYCRPLLRYLLRLTGSEHVAQELHQETWLSVLANLDRFASRRGEGGGFKAWLFRIATNKANDHWRSQVRGRSASEGLRLISGGVAPAAGTSMEGREELQRLQKAIATLPAVQKQVLLLRYYGNLKFAEIASLLGCPLNTALGRMHAALEKLRQAMQ